MQRLKIDGKIILAVSVIFCINFDVLLAICSCSVSSCVHAYWGTWTQWSSCSSTCGGGTRAREKTCINVLHIWSVHPIYTSHTQSESGPCAEKCFNGGNFVGGECVCPPLASGVCCEKLPECDPPCLNGGTCIASNTCVCLSKFYGETCEIGSEIEDRLHPHFYPSVSTLHHPLSWYDAPSISGYNKICYIKIQLENAYFDTVLTAVSKNAGNPSHIFGNFTAAPIDEDSKIDHTSRFACLKVRCPGTMSDGVLFNVKVDVTIQSSRRKCSVRKLLSPLDITTMTEYQNGNDAIVLELEPEKNYGEMYGVYVGFGFRDKAEYLAKQSCFSGNIFQRNQLLPDQNVLARFQCT